MLHPLKVFIVALSAITIALPGLAEETGTLKKLRDSGEIVLGVRDVSIPFSYLSTGGEPVGYSIDLCRKVVEQIKTVYRMPDLRIRLQQVTSATRILLVQNGTVDLECGSTVNNPERRQQVEFSLTTFVVNTKLVVKKESSIGGIGDLKGKVVAVTTGTNTSQKIAALNQRQALDLKIVNGTDHAQSFLLMDTGRAAAFSEDDILLAGLMASSGKPETYALVAIPGMPGDPYALMLRKDDPAFKTAVDTALRGIFASPDFRNLYDHWFVKPIPPKDARLNFPISDQLLRVVATPTDSSDPLSYR